MSYESIVKKVTNIIAITYCIGGLNGCAAPKVQMTMVQPPTVAEALKLKRIAIGEFEGRREEALAFTNDVENLLTSVRIQNKPYFEIISSTRTASALKTKSGSEDLSNPNTVRSVGSLLNVDAIMSGRVVRSDITENPFQEKRSQCARSKVQYNKKGRKIGETCVKWSNYMVGCIKRDAAFEFSPNLIDVSSNRSIFNNTLQGHASNQACADSNRPVSDGATLQSQARNDVLDQIRVALAPVESLVAAEIMEDSWLNQAFAEEIKSPASEKKFASGVEFAKAKRMDRACEIWKGLEPIESTHVPLLYNIGVCEEAAGNIEIARDYFVRADKLALKPEKRIAAALSRIGEQISSTQILTQARPDIFFRSAQARSAAQDQKLYGYTSPVNGAEVKIRNITAVPETVKVGDTLKVNMDFSVIAQNGTQDVNVQEIMTLKLNGKVLKTLVDESQSQSLGGHVSEVDFKIPSGMPAGTYVIEHKVQAGTSYDVRPVVFVVGS